MTDTERVRAALYSLLDPMSPDYESISVGYLAELAAKEIISCRAETVVLAALQAQVRQLQHYIASRRSLFTRVTPAPDNDRLPYMLKARVNELELLEAFLVEAALLPREPSS